MILLLRRNREIVALVLLLVLGAVVAQVAANRDAAGRQGPILSSRDANSTGALALALWLERLGYRVTQLEGSRSSPDDTVRYLFVLKPANRFSRADASAVINWIRRGGTLLYVPSIVPSFGSVGVGPGDGLGAEINLGLSGGLRGGDSAARPANAVLPFFETPPGSRFSVADPWTLDLKDSAWVPLIDLATTGTSQVIAAERRYGAGRVYAVASASFFDNAHLAEADNFALVLNALARGADERVVAFDEYHHGEMAAPDLVSALRVSPVGWAIAYAAIATFLFALWSGRRFGPPVARVGQAGRSAADYVTAFAGLLQHGPGARGATIAWAQAQYARLVRRELARAHGVRADLPAGDLARLLADRRPIDPVELAAHLVALGGPPVGEGRLLAEMRGLEPILRTLVPHSLEGSPRL